MQTNLRPNVSKALSRLAVPVSAFAAIQDIRGRDQKTAKTLQDLAATAKKTRHTLEGLNCCHNGIFERYEKVIHTIILSE